MWCIFLNVHIWVIYISDACCSVLNTLLLDVGHLTFHHLLYWNNVTFVRDFLLAVVLTQDVIRSQFDHS